MVIEAWFKPRKFLTETINKIQKNQRVAKFLPDRLFGRCKSQIQRLVQIQLLCQPNQNTF